MKMDAYAPDNDTPGGASSSSLSDRADLYTINRDTILRLSNERRAAEAALLPVNTGDTNSVYSYPLGPQDVLRVTVWDHPELTNPSGTANELSGRVINSDGTFFFPFVGKVKADGRTVQEVRDILSRGLAPYIKNPQIDVSVLQYRSRRAFVAGEVRTQGAVPITDVPVRITDAIATAGGLTTEADLSNVTVTRRDKTYRVDLYNLYYNGDLRSNFLLQHGDVVNIPERRFNKVFVLGEVLRPSSITLPRGRTTLAEALSDAGGVNPLTANAGQIYVLRAGENRKPQIFHLNAASPEALVLADGFDLRSRDVVWVDSASVVRWARVVDNILPTIDVLRNIVNDTTKAFPR